MGSVFGSFVSGVSELYTYSFGADEGLLGEDLGRETNAKVF